jgi:hypothetical protein
MKWFEHIPDLPPTFRDPMIKAAFSAAYNAEILRQYLVLASGSGPRLVARQHGEHLTRPYFKANVAENQTGGYEKDGNTQCPCDSLYAVWAWDLGRVGYDQTGLWGRISGGYATNVFVIDAEIDTYYQNGGPKIIRQYGGVHVFGNDPNCEVRNGNHTRTWYSTGGLVEKWDKHSIPMVAKTVMAIEDAYRSIQIESDLSMMSPFRQDEDPPEPRK